MLRPDLAEELEQLAAEDLAVRQRLLDAGELHGGYNPEMRVVHRRNGDRLTAVLDEVGCWPGFRLIGRDGSYAAFLIAQHDIANPALLRRSRGLYVAAVEADDAEPSLLANLEDRIRYFEGRSQLYGTHLGWTETGEFGPWPAVEDVATVDQRRAALGLGPLADAVDAARIDRPVRTSAAEAVREHEAAAAFARRAGWRDS